MTLLTSDQQKYAAVRERVEHRLKQFRDLSQLYRAPMGVPPVENQGSAMAIAMAIRELEAIAAIWSSAQEGEG